MDELDKIAIRLRHWIGHNLEHIKAYEDVAGKMFDSGMTDASNDIRQAVDLSVKANEKFESALSYIESKVGKHVECSGKHEDGHCGSSHGPHTHEHKETHHRHS
ncbi:MAG: hypothetical protein M0T73_00775 [Deltaproteobacteria bacterium]|nr:hypothetical protein [Deltaproteobacteria bacterium]